MLKFKQYLTEAGGQAAGKLEIDQSSVDKIYDFAAKVISDIDKEIPNFKKNLTFARKMTRLGKTQRKDMPVITDEDVKKLQTKLLGGAIDIKTPYANATNSKDPFPQGLSGKQARAFLHKGLARFDGNHEDDMVKVSIKSIPVGELKPIQKQIYADKSLEPLGKNGVANSKKFYAKSVFVASADKYIIDGHHRYLASMLVDPKMNVRVLTIELPIKTLLPMTLAYGDAIGNKRNQ